MEYIKYVIVNTEMAEQTSGIPAQELKPSISSTAERVIAQNFSVVEAKYSSNPFHDGQHTRIVTRRAGIIAKTISDVQPYFATQEHIEDAMEAASAHDLYLDDLSQDEEEIDVTVNGGTVHVWVLKKKRQVLKPGENEEKSADQHLASLDGVSEERKMRQRKAIMATVPDYDPKLQTIIQPNLGNDASVVEFAVAAGDLGGCSMDGAKQFILEGNEILMEDLLAIKVGQNDDYIYLNHIVQSPDILNQPLAKALAGVILYHSSTQAPFALGREHATKNFLNNWPQVVREALLGGVFTKFEESAEAAKNKYDQRIKMVQEAAGDYKKVAKDLLADLGYSLGYPDLL